jgi:hypothetical protein
MRGLSGTNKSLVPGGEQRMNGTVFANDQAAILQPGQQELQRPCGIIGSDSRQQPHEKAIRGVEIGRVKRFADRAVIGKAPLDQFGALALVAAVGAAGRVKLPELPD